MLEAGWICFTKWFPVIVLFNFDWVYRNEAWQIVWFGPSKDVKLSVTTLAAIMTMNQNDNFFLSPTSTFPLLILQYRTILLHDKPTLCLPKVLKKYARQMFVAHFHEVISPFPEPPVNLQG